MESIEPKKLSLIRILQVLEKETDIDHPLTHSEIVKKLEENYGIIIERKVVGRTISFLNDVGYEIETTKKGCYLAERKFDDAELKLLIDSVLSSTHINPKHSKDLIEKLCSLSNKYFRKHVTNIYSVNDWNKTENVSLFYNIEIIDEAIENEKQVRFDYNKYGVDKQMHRSAIHNVSPYQMILHNQRYYLMGFNEKWQHIRYYRMDRITNISLTDNIRTPIRSIDGYQNGIDYKQFSSALPYMYSDKPVSVEFLADEWVFDQIIDWFGKDISITPKGDKFIVKLNVSPMAMEHWAMQYANAIEIISPKELRNKIAENLKSAMEKYKNKGE